MSGPYRVIITEVAFEDLDAILLFIARDWPRRAMVVTDRIFERIRSLAFMPRRGRRAPESDAWGIEIRALLAGPFRILYTIDAQTVFVLRVVHGAREGPLPIRDA